MLFITIPNGTGYQIVNPYKEADRQAMNQANRVTVTIYGADKAEVLKASAAKLQHFSYAMGGFTVETTETTSKEEFSVTIHNCPIGMAFYFGIILARLAGRQQGIVNAEALTVYTQKSKIRKQFIKQFAPSVCEGGSDLRNCTDDVLFANHGFNTYIDPIFTHFGLYSHGSVALV